jgi:serine/threonine protein kinase
MLLQTCDDFVRTVRKSGLLDDQQLDRFLQKANLPDEPLEMAKAMIAADLITGFQAEQLLQGKSRGFDIGRYRVLKRLGGGSTGTVFLCEHVVMNHRVALKVLSREWMDHEPTALARFRREARSASALQHPNIVKTIDLDQDGDRHYLVMEYVEGVALDVLLKHKKQLPVRETVGFIVQALQGLQHIHECGMIHRDLKPGNLLLDHSGMVKILDLGLARFTDHRAENLTVQQGSLIMGTVDFMSPEQASAIGPIDIRSDIYSLGATLYLLLTGQTVVPEGSPTSKILAIQFHPPKPIPTIRPEVDKKLDAIIGRMLAKNPALRPQTPKEAIQALNDWLKTASTPAIATAPLTKDTPHRSLPVRMNAQSMTDTVPNRPAYVPPPVQVAAPTVHSTNSVEDAFPAPKSRAAWWMAIPIALLVLGGVGYWFVTQMGGK